ncbi:cytochrome c [Massilia cellulosiltytica]|uniref:c-type cytochrome n=1 Tax=Massilia cellulosiltytica TaxID=2683234 RepID=UPI0039B6D46C
MHDAMKLALAAMFVAVSTAAQAQEVKGADVFRAACAMCHQAEAQGAAGLAPPLKGSYWDKLAKTGTYVPGVLLAGMHGQITTDEGPFNGVMPTQNRLADSEIAALSNYLVQDVNGVKSVPAVTADEVAKLRAKTPSVSELRALRKQALAK